MIGWALEKAVRLDGRDVFGRRSSLLIEPADTPDWVWKVDGIDVPITPNRIIAKRRRVALTYGGCDFNEFEHVGILRAIGLRGVRVQLLDGASWPPYDGRSFALWQAVVPHMRERGDLSPFRPTCVAIQKATNGQRYVQYSRSKQWDNALLIQGVVHYPRTNAKHFWHKHPGDDTLPLVCARSLGWPRSLRMPAKLAGMCGWPHYGNLNWPGNMPEPTWLDEAVQHRILDLLSVINFAAPAELFLVGHIFSRKGGHATDVGLLHELAYNQKMALKDVA